MNEWDVVLAIAALVSLFFTLGKPIINLNKTITRNTAATENLQKSLSAFKEESGKTHREQWKQIHKNTDKLAEHETRISRMEDHKRIN